MLFHAFIYKLWRQIQRAVTVHVINNLNEGKQRKRFHIDLFMFNSFCFSSSWMSTWVISIWMRQGWKVMETSETQWKINNHWCLMVIEWNWLGEHVWFPMWKVQRNPINSQKAIYHPFSSPNTLSSRNHIALQSIRQKKRNTFARCQK